MTLLEPALALQRAGLSVVPVAVDGSKRPAVMWQQYQGSRAEPEELRRWFEHGIYDGLGIICGAVSGNLEMFEVEGRAVDIVPHLAQKMTDNGHDALWRRLCTGYLVRSPSGGMHWVYRVDGPAKPNTKLARRPGAEPNTVDVLIETRGEGGFIVTAPSAGRTHPSGNGWQMIAGGPNTIPTITVAERDVLYMAAREFDTMPTIDITLVPTYRRNIGAGSAWDDIVGLRPGDDYNERADWSDILGPHGWQQSARFGQGIGWTRPGKNPRDGISATTGTSDDGADRLYVFSSSTAFDTERPYSKFAAYALLEHGGDYAAAARELRRQGYGDQSKEDQWSGSFSSASLGTATNGTITAALSADGALSSVDPAATSTSTDAVAPSRMRDGASFILDAPVDVPSIWGDGDECLWSVGEALMLCGPPGVGKTTITGQVTRGLLGLQSEVLGKTITPTTGRILYLAMDRPQQIARSLRRVFGESERALLEERVRVWEGPPPGDVAKQPGILLHLAQEAEADILIVDSMKDAAVGLTEDEVAAAYNRARQFCLANGVQVLELHHMVKRGVGGNKPTELADVYGSAWLTAGAGSVVLIWGAAGDPIVELRHLKQPAAEVGPWRLIHDHDTGHTTIWHATDLLEMLIAAGDKGVTAKAAACATYEKEKPTRSEEQKVRNRLNALVEQGHATREDRPNGEAGGKPTGIYRVGVWSNHRAITGGVAENPNHDTHEQSRESAKPQVRAITNTITTITDQEQSHTPPPLEGGVVAPTALKPVEMLSCNACGRDVPAPIIEANKGVCGGCSLL